MFTRSSAVKLEGAKQSFRRITSEKRQKPTFSVKGALILRQGQQESQHYRKVYIISFEITSVSQLNVFIADPPGVSNSGRTRMPLSLAYSTMSATSAALYTWLLLYAPSLLSTQEGEISILGYQDAHITKKNVNILHHFTLLLIPHFEENAFLH